ncbi:MAG: hypothetical protein AB7I36_20580 [Rhodospirillaceae bacterium]
MSELSGEVKALMNNAAFVAALDGARRQAISAAMACDPKDDEGRRRYLDAARTVDRVAAHLSALVAADKTGAEPDPATYYQDQARKRWAFLGR